MSVTTYTFTNTSSGISNSWTTAADWSGSVTSANFKTGSSNLGAISAFDVGTATNPINTTITLVPGSGQTVNSFYMNDPNATLSVGTGNVTFINGITVNAGVVAGVGPGSTSLIIGSSASNVQNGVTITPTAGTIDLLSGGVLGNFSATQFQIQAPNANYVGAITGSGTVDAAHGNLDIKATMTVAAGSSLQFHIDNTSTLEFDGAVNSGTVDFTAGSTGLLYLTGTQVGVGGATAGTITNGTFGAAIEGMTAGAGFTDGIVFKAVGTLAQPNISASLINIAANSATLDITDGTNHFDFNLIGNYAGDTAHAVASTHIAGGTDIFLQVCYGAGTAILTAEGETPVEAIQPGDVVMTLEGDVQVPQTVKWVGARTIDLTRHPKPDLVAPVRILRGALGDNQPHRDLILSPDHCMLMDGGLIPVKLLVNDMTIVRETAMRSVTYHHIELDRHGVLIAEGVAAESYLDTGNRAFFANAGLATLLHPDLTINENLRCWEEDACAPLTVHPDAVKPVWDRIAGRAEALGFEAPHTVTTGDAAIHLVVDGRDLRPTQNQDGVASFVVPAGARSVRLVSRSVTPGLLTPWHDDFRTLGVAIRSVTMRDRSGVTVMPADHPALMAGWHAPEQTADGSVWRWTDGDANLPISAEGACTVEIAFHATSIYVQDQRLAA